MLRRWHPLIAAVAIAGLALAAWSERDRAVASQDEWAQFLAELNLVTA